MKKIRLENEERPCFVNIILIRQTNVFSSRKK